MRSRSSRLFFVLVHLVSTNVVVQRRHRQQERSSWWNNGIVGVSPLAIVCERLQLQDLGLEELLQRLMSDDSQKEGEAEDALLSQALYWLQDDIDGKCLGPMGQFADCGDASLWWIRRRPLYETGNDEDAEHGELRRKSRRRRIRRKEQYSQQGGLRSALMALFSRGKTQRNDDEKGNSDVVWRYALKHADPLSSSAERRRTFEGGQAEATIDSSSSEDCLLTTPQTASWETNDLMHWSSPSSSSSFHSGKLQLGHCSSPEAWTWKVGKGGVIQRESSLFLEQETWLRSGEDEESAKHLLASMLGGPRLLLDHDASSSKPSGLKHATPSIPRQRSACIRRFNDTAVLLPSCSSSSSSSERNRLVHFTLVRYEAQASSSPSLPPYAIQVDTTVEDAKKEKRRRNNPKAKRRTDEEPTAPKPPPHHNHITRSRKVSNINGALVVGPVIHPDAITKPASHLILASMPHYRAYTTNGGSESSSAATTAALSSSSPLRRSDGATSPLGGGSFRAAPAGVGSTHSVGSNTPHKIRKIPIHPYIAASKNLIWRDPSTGLEYLTDICGYLGHDCKVSGRHTLMGVGYYTKTAFQIKVYGIALYLSKRDVLADSNFVQYSDLTSDELRSRPDFYSYLHQPPSPDPFSGSYDRTLLLKLNMQLSTETMRSSLGADWKMLTEEHKTLIIDASVQARPADEAMLRKIQSHADNPSRCSCAQVAPPEYQADPTCCAKGTILAFTWRKDGTLEIRVDGRMIESFRRPDMATGIFFEYLRYDDPIGPVALRNFADGFPFLLAPLAQVKGVVVPRTATASSSASTGVVRGGRADDEGFLWGFGRKSWTAIVSVSSGLVSSTERLQPSGDEEDPSVLGMPTLNGVLSLFGRVVPTSLVSDSSSLVSDGSSLVSTTERTGVQVGEDEDTRKQQRRRRRRRLFFLFPEENDVEDSTTTLDAETETSTLQRSTTGGEAHPSKTPQARNDQSSTHSPPQRRRRNRWGRVFRRKSSGDSEMNSDSDDANNENGSDGKQGDSGSSSYQTESILGAILLQHRPMTLTHKLFSALVHFYLVLLLVISIPMGSNSTSVTVKRHSRSGIRGSAVDCSAQSSSPPKLVRDSLSSSPTSSQHNEPAATMKKSLSYYV